MIKHYKLIHGEIVEEPDLLKWAEWFENFDNRKIDCTIEGNRRVSTVFIGLDHGYLRSKKPILFETMIFDHEGNPQQVFARAATLKQAKKMHTRALWHIRKLRSNDENLNVS